MWMDERGRLFGRLSVVDLGLIGLVIALAPGWHFLWRSAAAWDPVIVDVVPLTFDTETGGEMTVFGKNFRRESVVAFRDRPLPGARYEVPDRLVVQVPPGVPPGRRPVTVTNPIGGVGECLPPKYVTITSTPEVIGVTPRRFRGQLGETILVTGRHFDPPCTASLGDHLFRELEFVAPDTLKIRVAPGQLRPGPYELAVTNSFGKIARRPEAIRVVDDIGVDVVFSVGLDTYRALEGLAAAEGLRPGGVRVRELWLGLGGGSDKRVLPTVLARVVLPWSSIQLAEADEPIPPEQAWTVSFAGRPVRRGAEMILPLGQSVIAARAVSEPVAAAGA